MLGNDLTFVSFLLFTMIPDTLCRWRRPFCLLSPTNFSFCFPSLRGFHCWWFDWGGMVLPDSFLYMQLFSFFVCLFSVPKMLLFFNAVVVAFGFKMLAICFNQL